MEIKTILFTYNRTKELRKCLSGINFPIDYAFIDKSNAQRDIHELLLLHNIFRDNYKIKEIIPRKYHHGLANSIISGVSEVFNRGADAVIVIEDDLLLKPRFYDYIRCMLISNKNYKDVGSVSGHCEFLEDENFKRFLPWGWGTWKDRWSSVNWDFGEFVDYGFDSCGYGLTAMYNSARIGKVDSWAIRFAYWHYINSKHCLHPDRTNRMLKHVGYGTHVKWYSNFGIRPNIRRIRKIINKII